MYHRPVRATHVTSRTWHITGEHNQPGDHPLGHTISHADVAEYLAGSAYPHITYHETSAAGAARLVANGADYTRTKQGQFGAGFYTSTGSEGSEGTASSTETVMQVAVRLENPIQGNIKQVQARMQEVLPFDPRRKTSPQEVREAMVRAGHDGVVLKRSDGEVWLIAYHDRAVKFVQG